MYSSRAQSGPNLPNADNWSVLVARGWRHSFQELFGPLLGTKPAPVSDRIARWKQRHNRICGIDVIRAKGRIVRLKRYAVEVSCGARSGVVDNQTLCALLTRIHILPLEAVRTICRAYRNCKRVRARPEQRSCSSCKSRRSDARESFLSQAPESSMGPGGRDDDRPFGARTMPQSGARERSLPAVSESSRWTAKRLSRLWTCTATLVNRMGTGLSGSGVTSVRDVGGERILTALRDALATIGVRSSPSACRVGDGDGPEAYGMTTAATAEQGRAVVDAYHRAGFFTEALQSAGATFHGHCASRS